MNALRALPSASLSLMILLILDSGVLKGLKELRAQILIKLLRSYLCVPELRDRVTLKPLRSYSTLYG